MSGLGTLFQIRLQEILISFSVKSASLFIMLLEVSIRLGLAVVRQLLKLKLYLEELRIPLTVKLTDSTRMG